MRGRKWTEAEDELIRRRRAEHVAVPLIAAEIGREVKATYARAAQIGAKVMARTEWTEDEVEILVKMNADRSPIKVIARALDRSTGSVRWKLEDLDIAGGRLRYWTDAEDAELRRLAEGRTVAEVKLKVVVVALAAINGGFERDEATVDGRIRALKLYAAQRRRWSETELDALKLAVETGDLVEFARANDRPIERVEAKAASLGFDVLKRVKVRRAEAVENRSTRAIEAAAKIPDRGIEAVVIKVRELDRTDALKPTSNFVAIRPARVIRTVAAKAANAVPGGTSDMSDAVARFMAEKGVTKVQMDPTDELVTSLRRRGFTVVEDEDGWLIDGRRRVEDIDELEAFARRRGSFLNVQTSGVSRSRAPDIAKDQVVQT